MTARTPGFTDEQRALTCRSIRDMKFWLSHNPCIGDTPIEPVWRLTDGLDQEIRVTNSLTDVSGRDLADVLNRVDAVLTTASTAMLEAMLLGLPVALLDYHGCPQFVPAAWTISAPRHLDQILPELINPAPAKMLFQDTVLHDSLECLTPAAPRMVQLVEAMLRIGYQCRQAKQPVAFPSRILQDDQAGHHMLEKRFNMRQLYPDQPAFSENDSTVLQVELELSRRETRRLRNLIKADNFFRELSKTIPGPRKLMRLWRESRKLARGSELHRR